MPNTWFTADTHFGHARIIQYCNRPFQDAEEQDEAILERFNSVIKPGDLLYHLGDICWSTFNLSKFFGRLNTQEVHLIKGNHDNKHGSEYSRFRSVSDLKHLSVGVDGTITAFVLCHYPMRTWKSKGRGGYHLYGHVHGRMPGLDRSMDVGVDTNNFYPYSAEEIVAKLKDQPFYAEEGKN